MNIDINRQKKAEVKRLESLWAGDFGDDYVDRNKGVQSYRSKFWTEVLNEFPVKRVLEVGCNIGGNIAWIARSVAPEEVWGLDVNRKALQQLRRDQPGVNAVFSPARELPFRDGWFDMTFTMGVLIHQPPEALPLVMSEIVRCSKRYVLCGEYFSEELTEVPYRGQSGALFKRNFGKDYQSLFPELKLRKQGFLSKDEGWDDVTYWIFEKTQV